MHACFSGLFLLLPMICASTAIAEPLGPPPIVPADLRALLDDPNGDLARVAKSVLGNKGGNQLFYFPTREAPETPANWGFKYETLHFKSADGTPLHGWFVPPKTGTPKGTIVFSHGNAGCIGHHLGFVMWLAEAGYNVMMFDYRGFGKSGGTLDRRGMIDDVKAAFTHVVKRPDVDAKNLISYGHSLGGAKSVTALGEITVKGLRAIVIDGAFASYQTMARVMGGQLGASLVSDELAPGDYVAKLTPVPLLVVHGTRDEVVPFSQGKQLFDKAREPKTLFEVKGGRHGDSLARDGGKYRTRMLAWLSQQMDG